MTYTDYWITLQQVLGAKNFAIYIVIITVHTIIVLVLLVHDIVKNLQAQNTLAVAICKSLDKYSLWVTVYLLISTLYFASAIPFLVFTANIISMIIWGIYLAKTRSEDLEPYQTKSVLYFVTIWAVIFAALCVAFI